LIRDVLTLPVWMGHATRMNEGLYATHMQESCEFETCLCALFQTRHAGRDFVRMSHVTRKNEAYRHVGGRRGERG